MDFSKLRHRVIFLKPLDKRLNSMNENVPVWIPFKPKLSSDINAAETSVYVLTDNFRQGPESDRAGRADRYQ